MDFDFTETQLALIRLASDFNKREIEPIAGELDEAGKLQDHLIKRLAEVGLLGMAVPEKYGGSGSGYLNCVLACEQLAYSGTAVWWLVSFNNSIPQSIYRFGSEQQKEKYLHYFCDGSSYASLQFTEEETGSDPAALKTIARKEGNYYIINGLKRFSTFGARDGYAILHASVGTGKTTAFIVKKNIPGYSAVGVDGEWWRRSG